MPSYFSRFSSCDFPSECPCPSTFQGWELFSGDCFGNILSWDVRSRGCVRVWSVGPTAVNKLAVDPARSLLACSSDEQVVFLLDLTTPQAPPTHLQTPGEQPKVKSPGVELTLK